MTRPMLLIIEPEIEINKKLMVNASGWWYAANNVTHQGKVFKAFKLLFCFCLGSTPGALR